MGRLLKGVVAILVVIIAAGVLLYNKAPATFDDIVQQLPEELAQQINSIADSFGNQRPYVGSHDINDMDGPYDIVRVVDGDTVLLNINGSEKRCRLIGVDTPESVHPDESRNVAEGKTASEWTKELLDGHQVYLEYDLSPTDQYGRELVYLYLDDGRMVQEELLRAGMATTMTIQPNSKYASHFSALQKEAQSQSVGLWATFFN